ncbi:hypothetical protein ACFYO2_41280 [Streptomyces sp. NPDC006602]|uniref:hypothetical protein n=1 Tax=Streptomyces sp. NPDC006602 TaxID=3364751 RepID=UPI0036982CD3
MLTTKLSMPLTAHCGTGTGYWEPRRRSHRRDRSVMISHALEQGVLVITVHNDPGICRRADLLRQISDLVRAHKPDALVIVLDDPAATEAAVSVVVRVPALQRPWGLDVRCHPERPARRLLEANADTRGTRLVIHARADIAVATAAALTAAA